MKSSEFPPSQDQRFSFFLLFSLWWKCFLKRIQRRRRRRSEHFVQTHWQFCCLCSCCDLQESQDRQKSRFKGCVQSSSEVNTNNTLLERSHIQSVIRRRKRMEMDSCFHFLHFTLLKGFMSWELWELCPNMHNMLEHDLFTAQIFFLFVPICCFGNSAPDENHILGLINIFRL